MKKELEHSLFKDLKSNSKSGIEKILAKKINFGKKSDSNYSSLWKESSFNLDKVSLYNGFNQAQQNQVLSNCAQSRLLESYAIEDAGMSYCAKMSLLAHSQSEQMLYSTFAQEEAIHLSFIQRFIDPDNITNDSFISLLKEVVIHGSRRSLLLIMQIILEGWGLEHYKKMQQGAIDPELKEIFSLILIDEASHHGSGLVLFNTNNLTTNEYEYIKEVLAKFLYMVGCGPWALLNSIEQGCGHLNKRQKNMIYHEINGEQESMEKLNIIKKLLIKAGVQDIADDLEKTNCFKPQWDLK